VTAQELFQAGRLTDAVQAMNAEVKSHPTDPDRRTCLFAFLAFTGELDRADRQLDVLGTQDPKMEIGSRVYRNLLASEQDRRNAFEKTSEPMLPPDPPDHARQRVEALKALRANDEGAVERHLDAAADASPALAGAVDGRAFSSIRDADGLLGSVLEVFAGGRYLWLPFERIRSITIESPRQILDLLWIPTKLEDVDGTRAQVHIPALYPRSHGAGVDAIRMGRATEWVSFSGALCGVGQRILDAAISQGEAGRGAEEIPILALRELRFSPEASGASAA
jgi:type VI secretion system protein ImpE